MNNVKFLDAESEWITACRRLHNLVFRFVGGAQQHVGSDREEFGDVENRMETGGAR